MKFITTLLVFISPLFAQEFPLPIDYMPEQKMREYFDAVLLNRNTDLNSPIGNSIAYKLHAACKYDSLQDIVKVMLERNARIDLETPEHINVFHICASFNSTALTAKLLMQAGLKQGCDIHRMINQPISLLRREYWQEYRQEYRPLDIALDRCNYDLVHFFAQCKATHVHLKRLFPHDEAKYTPVYFIEARKILALLYVYDFLSAQNIAALDDSLNLIERQYHLCPFFKQLYSLIAHSKNAIIALDTMASMRAQAKKPNYIQILPADLTKKLLNFIFQIQELPKKEFFDIKETDLQPADTDTSKEPKSKRPVKLKPFKNGQWKVKKDKCVVS